MENRNIYDEFIGQFSLSKTLKFSLNPVGKTGEWIIKNGVLENDEEKADNYLKLKKLCDVLHKEFIEEVLRKTELNGLEKFEKLFVKRTKTEDEKKEISLIEENLRKEISKKFTKDTKYKKLKGKELIKSLKERFKDSESALEVIEKFERFSTYLKGFNENRENIYSAEDISTSIGYRIIKENLPKFIENKKIYNLIKGSPIRSKLEEDKEKLLVLLKDVDLDKIFTIEFFNKCLSQEQIEFYNMIIGGKTLESGEKIKGLNEYINEYNQVCEKKDRVPKLKELFKQILSDREKKSFVIETITSDKEVIEILEILQENLNELVIERKNSIGLKALIKNIKEYDLNKIYIKNDKTLTEVSQRIFSKWEYILDGLKEKYDIEYGKKNTVVYEKEKEKYFKNRESFSIEEINEALKSYGSSNKVEDLFIEFKNRDNKDYIAVLNEKYSEIEALIKGDIKAHKKGLRNDIKNKEKIKAYLDAGKEMQRFLKLLSGSGKEGEKEEKFYSEFEDILIKLDTLNLIYNKIRNYVTKKPYSNEKIKLNFNNPTLLDGWAKNKEIDNSCIIFRERTEKQYEYREEEREIYYLGIMNNKFNKEFKEYKEPIDEKDIFEKMVYLQAADPAKDVQNMMVINGNVEKKNGRKDEDGVNRILENLKNENLPIEINEIRKKRTFSREDKEKFNKEDLIKFIDFYKEMAKGYYKDYEFIFKESKEYYSFKEFTDDINRQAYQIRFNKVSKKAIQKLVEEGKLYLFEIYNKDFSVHSRGTKNLHTIYFEMLFNKENLENVVYKLNGQGEMFYRKRSINKEEQIIHHAGEVLENKNKIHQKKRPTAVYQYDIVKDKRYTVDTFHLHVPITLNFGVEETKNINEKVNRWIKEFKDINIIGIDRGERNLLYATVIDKNGVIKEQKSFNIIKGGDCEVNYKGILSEAERKRNEARVSWDTIQGIKDIKEGYLSQVIHQICQMMIKYNGIIVLEDLNGGFKNSRKKFETSVYQKFEKMLIDKLNFYVDKRKNINDYGGALKGYQLTNKFESFKKLGKQSGILFYVPAWNTSKIDPTTGFVNLYNFKYENLNKAKELISKINRISYNEKEEYFEFEIDYSKLNNKLENTKKLWVLCSHGKGIIQYRNKEKNNNWDVKEIQITEELINLFKKYKIEYNGEINIKEQILKENEKELFEGILNNLKLIVQLRKSIENEDYILSPVKNSKGEFFDSRKFKMKKENEKIEQKQPEDADANGAYNIGRKGLLLINKIRNIDIKDLKKVKLTITNEEWLQFAQKQA